MIEEELRGIEERANSATPGPWFAGYWSGQCHMKHRHDPRICQYDYTLSKRKGDSFIGVVNEERNTVVGVSYDDIVMSEADNQFIAHAREDIPALIAEIRLLRSTIDAMLEWDNAHNSRDDPQPPNGINAEKEQ